MWDNIGTVHRAIADYGPQEHRLMKRCQIIADREVAVDASHGTIAR
jgi:taurine dioxygenase